jgi:hypothetical protein
VRFLGRKVYVAAIVFIATVWWILDGSLDLAARALGVPARTILRWWHWWTASLPRSAHWGAERGRLAGDVDLKRLPLSLLERFGGETPESRLRRGLVFMAPATTESASFVRVEAFTQKLAFE